MINNVGNNLRDLEVVPKVATEDDALEYLAELLVEAFLEIRKYGNKK